VRTRLRATTALMGFRFLLNTFQPRLASYGTIRE
jgi:hypothetical protein